MKITLSLTLFLIYHWAVAKPPKETITFKSSDGVKITADVYIQHPETAPFIILFHQAGWSRGEYLPIAPRLNKAGYNCMAVDLRSGKGVNGVDNETYRVAKRMMKQTQYLQAIPDMMAAIAHAGKYFAQGQLIIWGSSYSASLVLHIAGGHPDRVDAVLAFSPGEYFTSFGKPADFIAKSAFKIKVPVFITSAHKEKATWWPIYEAIPGESKIYYLPENSSGNHGAKALWPKYYDSKGYWKAVKAFLAEINKLSIAAQ